jgi:chromate transporter
MIFFQLFYTFLYIGAFTFGGGYAMVALIQDVVVVRHAWLTAAEFTDLLAVSQMTPGPVGINTATYAGYAAVAAAGYPQWAAVMGALLASLAVVAIPVSLVLTVGGWLLHHQEHPRVVVLLRTLRMVAIGLVAAAALSLLTPDNFGTFDQGLRLPISIAIFAVVLVLTLRRRVSPLVLIVASGLAGLLFL